MQKVDAKKLYRIVDANFNRAKEGVRVCEDICRFILDKRVCTKEYKMVRHDLSNIMNSIHVVKLIGARNIREDVGKQSVSCEFKRKNVLDIFYANSQRSKESIRVLEEFVKLINKGLAQDLKRLRYQVYDLEKRVVAEC